MRPKRANGFTLGQLIASLMIITTAAILIGCVLIVEVGRRGSSPQTTCLSNLQQINVGLLVYSQDNDERFPPAAQPIENEKGVLSGWAVTHNLRGKATVSARIEGKTATNKFFHVSPLYAYLKDESIYRCPNAPRNAEPLSYMYNDLASGKPVASFTSLKSTVLVCDGEDFGGNVGHSYSPTLPPAPATFLPTGKVIVGATLQKAPLRHSGGANYGFVDGHAKWNKPDSIYFPSRFDWNASHKDAQPGRGPAPSPGGDMRGFQGTFHIN